MTAIIIRVVLMLIMLILIGLMCATWKYFNMLPESNKYKSVLACDVVVFMGFIIYIGIKIICR